MEHRNEEETVTVVRDTRQGNVPGQERRQQREEPACFDEVGVRRVHGVTANVADTEQEERQIKRQKEGEERHG